MKKFMCTAAVVAFSLYATAQEVADSAKIDILLLPNVELNEVNVLGTWAQKDDPIAQINLTEKDVEALNTGRDLRQRNLARLIGDGTCHPRLS